MIFPSEFLMNNSYPNCFQFMIEKTHILFLYSMITSPWFPINQSSDIHTVDGCEILKTTKWMVERC